MSQWLVEKRECDYDYLTYTVEMLSYVYPFVKLSTIGYTWAGRKIYSLSLGNQENQSLYTASTHGGDSTSTVALLRFVEELCKYYRSDKELSSINVSNVLKDKGALFVPCVNPDGVEINHHGYKAGGIFTEALSEIENNDFSNWQANARGVDLTLNYNADWNDINAGSTSPSPFGYSGVTPESELETYALTKLCRENNFSSAFDLHMNGKEICHKYKDYYIPDSDLMAKILSSASGYTISDDNELSNKCGFKNWFIKEFEKPAFTIKVGNDNNNLSENYYKLREMLILGLLF